MDVKELGHIVLYVSDLEQSVHFYSEVLGWYRLPAPPGLPIAAFSSGRTHHELLLIEVGSDAAPMVKGHRLGLYHFGLKVGDSDEELKAALEQLQKYEVPLLGATDHTVTHSLYIADPDGNEIELYVDVPEMDWKSDPDLFMTPPRPLNLS